jgi:23S rRNA pseudouridine2605 synthase
MGTAQAARHWRLGQGWHSSGARAQPLHGHTSAAALDPAVLAWPRRAGVHRQRGPGPGGTCPGAPARAWLTVQPLGGVRSRHPGARGPGQAGGLGHGAAWRVSEQRRGPPARAWPPLRASGHPATARRRGHGGPAARAGAAPTSARRRAAPTRYRRAARPRRGETPSGGRGLQTRPRCRQRGGPVLCTGLGGAGLAPGAGAAASDARSGRPQRRRASRCHSRAGVSNYA